MATRPIICGPEDNDGFLFNEEGLVLFEGGNLEDMINMSLKNLNITAYGKTRYKLVPGKSFLLAQTDLSDIDGYVKFIGIIAKYPENTFQKNKYISWEYRGRVNYMGEILVLTGNRSDTGDIFNIGWNLSYDGNEGGIVFTNPHNPESNIIVDLEIMIAR